MDRITDACQNITFSQLLLRTVIKVDVYVDIDRNANVNVSCDKIGRTLMSVSVAFSMFMSREMYS